MVRDARQGALLTMRSVGGAVEAAENSAPNDPCRFYGLACVTLLLHTCASRENAPLQMGLMMKIDDVRRNAYSMPLTNPSFPPGPYRFYNREYFVISYRTDPEALAAVVPEPLRSHRPDRQIRIHPDAGFDRLRRLHRNRAGDPGPLQRRGRRLYPLDVSRRRRADRGRPRTLGISQEAGDAEDRGRERRAGGIAALRLGAVRVRHHGLQASAWSTTTPC